MRAGKGILGCEIHGVGLSFGERRCDGSILGWVGNNGASPPDFCLFCPRRVRGYVRNMAVARNGGRGGLRRVFELGFAFVHSYIIPWGYGYLVRDRKMTETALFLSKSVVWAYVLALSGPFPNDTITRVSLISE